jgi:hypothetical protein
VGVAKSLWKISLCVNGELAQDIHAIEFDFGNNWAEAIGQSSCYSMQAGKKAGIVLILENMKDRKYWIRLNTTIEHFNLSIDTWNVGNAAY